MKVINKLKNNDNEEMKLNATNIVVATGTKKGKNLPKYMEEISKDVYSTNEIKTNEVWIDGKPIYRYVQSFMLSSNTNVTIPFHSVVSNFDTIWINEGKSFIWNGSESLAVNWYNSSTDWCRIWLNTSGIRFKCGGNLSNRTVYLVLEYTKTTDN